jgi:PHR domain
VDPTAFQFYLNLSLVMHLPELSAKQSQVQLSSMRVHIIEPLSVTLLNPLQKLMACDFLIIHKGKLIDPKNSPKELELEDGAELMCYGSLSSKIENLAFSSVALKFFRRFRDVRNDGWYIGRDRWDGVIFIAKRDVRIFGCGIFEPYPQSRRDFKYGYKYVLKDVDDTEITTSEVFEEEVICPEAGEIEDHIIKHKFVNHPQGIKVKRDQKFNFASWICYNDSHNRCFYQETGDRPLEIQSNPDPGIFDVQDSNLSSNSTRLNRGIIPGLLYALA